MRPRHDGVAAPVRRRHRGGLSLARNGRTTNENGASAIALAALAQPASAITFPTLTTIYVGAGVKDDGGAGDAGIATSFLCSNVSGRTADIRFLVLNHSGSVV